MHIRSVHITRKGHYNYAGEKLDVSQPFLCTVETQSAEGKMELVLSPHLSERILEIIAEELAASARETAEAMVASVFTSSASLIEAPVEEASVETALTGADEIPF